MNIKKIISLAAAAALSCSLVLSSCGKDEKKEISKAGIATSDNGSVDESLTATELVRKMGNGINLGNTMEAYGHSSYSPDEDMYTENYETLWGQPVTTQEMVDGMKAAGFDSLRVPVAWTNAMDYESGDYTINTAYLDRVEEIINYGLNADMYVIVNDHWDGGWWGMFGSSNEDTRKKAMDMYKSMWKQIAERYANYSDKLIFESANEELGDRLNEKAIAKDSGSLSQDECYSTANEINQEFVNTVRASGGNNDKRFLLIAGYNTDITMTCDDRFKMPDDTAKNKLLLSVHYYTPWDYCGTSGVTHWGSVSDYEEQNRLLKMMTKYTDQGYGVIIGEYAVLTDGASPKDDADLFYTNFLDNCDIYNYCPVLWDCNNLYRKTDCLIQDTEMSKLFLDRSLSKQSDRSEDKLAEEAKARMDAALKDAEDRAMEDVSLPASDDKAIAWIMYQSSDYNVAYSVGDVYDPTSKTDGVKAQNVEITGEGTYTVSLDLSQAGNARGVAFSALGISNGEKLFPGYVVDIDQILINGSPYELDGKEYTCSDDGVCTRVNLYNGWVSDPPEDARTSDGVIDDASPEIMKLDNSYSVSTISITFTYKKGQ